MAYQGVIMTLYLSQHMTKPTKWPVQPVKTQISLGIHPVWSESLLCTYWVAKDPKFPHFDSRDSDQTGRIPRLIWVFTGRTGHFLCPATRKWRGIMLYPPKFWVSVRPSVCLSVRPSVRANIRGLGASLSMIMRFIPLRIHWVALKPIFCLRFRGYFSMGV